MNAIMLWSQSENLPQRKTHNSNIQYLPDLAVCYMLQQLP